MVASANLKCDVYMNVLLYYKDERKPFASLKYLEKTLYSKPHPERELR